MIYKSFGIVRTNVGLTTNVKLMVQSDYKLYLDSIDSNNDLSLSKFKKFGVNKKDKYDKLIPNFYKEFPSELAFDIKYDNDVDSMKDDFKFQHDEIYQYGARNIINNKSYSEEFEYFAPLYIFPDNLPNSFIIFRVDDPGLEIVNKDNFRSNVIRKFKTVKRFDLTKKTQLGEWLDTNYTRNDSFPISPLDIDFKRNEFSKWNGIDYKTGGYVSKSLFLEEWFGEEKEIFEMEKFIFDGFKDNKVVFPNILNLSFLFDDTPSTPDKKRKWSLNRYYGFYFDEVEHITSTFPIKTKALKQNIQISENNVITSEDGYPFLDEWNDNITNYIEIEGVFYRIERLQDIKEPEIPSDIINDLEDDVVIIDLQNKTESTNINSAFVEEFLDDITFTYKIISDKVLSQFTYDDINNNTTISINSENELKIGDLNYSIDLFENADIWLIEINGILHNLILTDTGSLKIVSDYSFTFNDESTFYSYKVGGEETKVSITKQVGEDPEEFKIYRLRFTDLKDFDTRIVDTEPSKFEYELKDELTDTDESKMYVTDLNSDTNPKDIDSFVIDEKLVNIPVSSEYTANYETFKITEQGLTELWRKNSVYCRWGFQKSISANDYPYVLNNSLLFEDFNRTTNPFDFNPKRIERNLDYFYTINSDSSDYIHHSLHVEEYNSDFSLFKGYKFDLNKYLDPNGYDYFSNFFNTRSNFLNGQLSRNTIKHSYFNKGDDSIPNVTLFRGIKFLIYDVEDIRKNENGNLDIINLKSSNEFQDYRFSILLSDNKSTFEKEVLEPFQNKECELPVEYYRPYSGLGDSFSQSTSGDRRLYVDGAQSAVDGLKDKYILFGDDMTTPNISTPSFTTTDYCEHEVLYKVNSYGYDSTKGFYYITLTDPFGNSITDPNLLPTSLGTFSTIDSLDDYPYMLVDINSNIEFGDEFTLDSGGNLYEMAVTETGFINSDYYIKAIDKSGDGIVLPPGGDINVHLGNGATGSILNTKTFSENDMKWIIIENWQMDKEYNINSYVSYEDIIYRYIGSDSIITDQPNTTGPNNEIIKSAPYNIDGWEVVNNDQISNSPFLNLNKTYNLNDIVYSNGDYYYYKNNTSSAQGYDFWNPIQSGGYDKNQIVLHKGRYYESLIIDNIYSPSDNYEGNWQEVIPSDNDIKWDKIGIWNPSIVYTDSNTISKPDLVVHNEVVYSANQLTEQGDEPGLSDKWDRVYSLVADSDIKYKSDENPIIRFNNNYYLIVSNSTDTTLDNGIKIYINKKWKNILVNIEIKDNTTPNLKNVNRDELYIDLNKKLTANNFVNCLNDISNRYDFIDYLKYIIIDEEGECFEYDFNDLEGLPYLINCEFPDELEVKIDSLNTENIDLNNDLIANKVIKDGVLVNNDQLNYYNGVPIAVKITDNKNEPKTFSNFGGNQNFVNNLLYRFSGFYMPIFYDVHMFFKGVEKRTGSYPFRTLCSPPVTFDKVDTSHLPYVNPIPEGEFSYRTFIYDDKLDDPNYNQYVFKSGTGSVSNEYWETYITPVKAGWDAVLVNYERNASFYHNSLPDDKKYVESSPNPWGLSETWVFSANWLDVGFFTPYFDGVTKLSNKIAQDTYLYKTPHDITPYIGWYIVASDFVKAVTYTGYYTMKEGGDICPVVVMYQISNASFNEETGFYEFSVLDPDGNPPIYGVLQNIYDLILVENLHDNFGAFVNNLNLELEIGDEVDIIEIDCNIPNNEKPFYIKDIVQYDTGFFIDVYDANDNRVSFEDGCGGIISLPKSNYVQNYRFNTELTEFGNMLEKKISKINRKGSILKLKDKTDIRSIYPMLDEFGYTYDDFFVFKGTFDYNYHIETYNSESDADGLIDVNNIKESFNLGKK